MNFTATDSTDPSPPFWPAWVCWAGVQLAVFGLIALRVPFAARLPASIEQFAAAGLAVTQLIIAALLARALFRTFERLGIVLATALPLLLLAGRTAGLDGIPLIAAVSLPMAWLTAFAAIIRVVPTPAGHAGLILLAIGSPVAAYLSLEFANPSGIFHRIAALLPNAQVSPPIGTHLAGLAGLVALPIALTAIGLAVSHLRRQKFARRSENFSA